MTLDFVGFDPFAETDTPFACDYCGGPSAGYVVETLGHDPEEPGYAEISYCKACSSDELALEAAQLHARACVGASDAQRRFWSKVPERPLRADACWAWQGYCQPEHRRADGRSILGYGQFRANGAMHKAHVVAYVFANGPVPRSRVVGHTCDNPRCVRPSHLRAISRSDNMRQMHARARHPGFGDRT